MPRIRKKTSSRGTTHDRKKIQQKVAETHKKNKKKARKDVTWKSNKRVDPGIPNNFPYKDQVLAEIADQRRQLEEDRAALKAANKGKRIQKAEDDSDDEDAEPVGQPGVSLVAGKRILEAPAKPKAVRDDSPPPLLFDSDLPTLQAALEKADVWLEVVDARDPLGSRSPWLEQLFETPDEGDKVAKGKIVVVLTKIDLVPREALDQWLLYFRPRFPTILFKSFVPASNVPPPPASASSSVASTSTGFALSEIVGKDALLSYLSKWATAKSKKTPDEEFTVTLAGLPSVGKTSLLNSLLSPAHGLPITSYPQKSTQTRPTTTTPTGVTLELAGGISIKCVDTPGWVFEDVFPEDLAGEQELEEEEIEELWDVVDENRVKDLLRRNLGRLEKVKEALPVAEYIIAHSSASDLQLRYSTAVHDSTDPESFLIAFARATGRLKKGAAADLDGSARALLRDWSLGLFPRYTLPPKGLTLDPRQPADLKTLKAFTEGEKEVLERTPTRKEMMKASFGGRGLIRMKLDEAFEAEGGDVRAVVLDDEVREEEASDEEDEDFDEEDIEMEGEWTDDGEEDDDVSEAEDAEMEDDFAEGEIEDDDEEAPSALDILLAANPTLVSGGKADKKGKKASNAPAAVAVPPPAPAASKKAAKADKKKKVVFAGEKPKTVPSDIPKEPVSILKAAKGKKAAAAVVKAKQAELPVVDVASKKDKREKKRKTEEMEAVAPVKEAKKAKAAAAPAKKAAPAAPAAVKASKTSSKASQRAEEKGQVPYSFDSHFF